MGLVACNNNNDNALDNEHGTFNVNNADNNKNVRDANLTRSPNHDENLNDNDFDNEPDLDDNDLNISSMKTVMSSNKYPHTQAVLLQESRYKFVKIDPNQASQLQQFQQRSIPIKQQQQAPQPVTPAPQQPAPVQKQQPAPAQKQAPTQQAAPQNASQAVQKVIDLTNAQRRKNGLPNLTGDSKLNGVAQKKSSDMAKNNYFSHTSPTYGSPFDMMRDMGVTYRTAGENIAQGQTTPEQVVQSWMNSEGHRKNILSRDFTHIGVGYDQNGHHWTQMFIGK